MSDRKGWSRKFDEPIPLQNGRKLTTLRESGEYIAALPPRAQKLPEWHTAAQALMLVAESGGPTMMARIGMMRALDPRNDDPPKPRRKRVKSYRVVK